MTMIALAAGGFAVAACGSPAQSQTAPATAPLIISPAPTYSRPGPAFHQAGDQDNGKTVTVNVGDTVEIHLNNTYWRFAAPTGAALRMVGTPKISTSPPLNPQIRCVPGEGCGSVTANFTSVAAGTAVVTATRTSCGEALACRPGQGTYTVTVVVR
jgi:hypothetical protein